MSFYIETYLDAHASHAIPYAVCLGFLRKDSNVSSLVPSIRG